MLELVSSSKEPLEAGSVFSGIGGMDFGLEQSGIKIKWQCERHPFCRQVLEARWPKLLRFTDVRYVTRNGICENIKLLAGGFPCQPVSLAGSRNGYSDDRWLWPEFRRVIQNLQPKYVLIENVEGLRTLGLKEVLSDLAHDGYDAEWACLPAALVGAPHIRKRLFIVGYPVGYVQDKAPAIFNFEKFKEWALTHFTSDVMFQRLPEGGFCNLPRRTEIATRSHSKIRGFGWWQAEPGVVRMANGITYRLDRHRALGNTVVPQLASFIGYAINELEYGKNTRTVDKRRRKAISGQTDFMAVG